jgi:hypothetical protein
MDRILEVAWQQQEKPFHAETIIPDDLIPVSILRLILKSIVKHCEIYYPLSYCTIYKFDDWHEHDGYATERSPVTFQELYAVLESDELFYQSRHQDDYVYYAVYPDSMDFLLRYNLLDEDKELGQYPDIWGDFSFTGYDFDLWEISKRLRDYRDIAIGKQNSKQYFARPVLRWNGLAMSLK